MLTLNQAANILKQDQLLREIVIGDDWRFEVPANLKDRRLQFLSYDSRHIAPDTLFMCKGLNFNEKYLEDAIDKGAVACVTENVYAGKDQKQVVQLVVNDVQKAMALLAREFYNNPQQELKVIGFTGTKGKTTSVYFARHLMNEVFDHKVAQLSSIAECLDGEHFEEAHLTTPESLDLFRMMRQAADNGMQYLIMEVSSQAYKKSRVYGLHFDIGVFLNIAADHISPVEHPSFEDYLYCKSQLMINSSKVIINRECPYYDLLAQKALAAGNQVISFGSSQSNADYRYVVDSPHEFHVATFSSQQPQLTGRFKINIPGTFNDSNALAALVVGRQFSDDTAAFAKGLEKTTVPGRMEMLSNQRGLLACVDYAHNYLSLNESFKYMKNTYPNGRLIVVIGAAGGKAESRRKDIGEALAKYADVAILTSEDNFFEDPYKIDEEIKSHIDNPDVEVHINVDRVKAIQDAFNMARPGDVMFMAAKGREQFMHEKGHDIPYVGDYQLTKKLMREYDE